MNTRALGYIVLVLAIAVLGYFAFVKNHTAKNAETPVQSQTEEKLTILQKTDKKVSIENKNISIDVTYPVFEAVPSNTNAAIKKFVDDEVAMIKSLAAESKQSSFVTTYTLNASYEIEQANTSYVSLVFTVNEDTGGAHPNQYFRTFNYNLKTGVSMNLADVFAGDAGYFAILKPKIKVAVHDALEANLKEQGDNDTNPDSILFEDISKLKEDAFQHFTFGSNYVRFFFSPYDIAPYVFGPIVVNVQR